MPTEKVNTAKHSSDMARVIPSTTAYRTFTQDETMAHTRAVVLYQSLSPEQDLHRCICNGGDFGSILGLLERKADASWSNPDAFNRTPLMEAGRFGYLDVTRLLIEHDAALDMQANGGWTALHYAAYNARADVVWMLAQSGAKLNLQCHAGQSPLHAAMASSKADSVKAECLAVLLEYGCDLALVNGKGQTAVSMARQRNDSKCAAVLERHVAMWTKVRDAVAELELFPTVLNGLVAEYISRCYGNFAERGTEYLSPPSTPV
eukprot:g43289.t1